MLQYRSTQHACLNCLKLPQQLGSSTAQCCYARKRQLAPLFNNSHTSTGDFNKCHSHATLLMGSTREQARICPGLHEVLPCHANSVCMPASCLGQSDHATVMLYTITALLSRCTQSQHYCHAVHNHGTTVTLYTITALLSYTLHNPVSLHAAITTPSLILHHGSIKY